MDQETYKLVKTKNSQGKKSRKPVEEEVGKFSNPTIALTQETNELVNDFNNVTKLKADGDYGTLVNLCTGYLKEILILFL